MVETLDRRADSAEVTPIVTTKQATPTCRVCGEPAEISFTPLRLGTVYTCTDHQPEVEDIMTSLIGDREYRVRRLSR
jgi:hypothetical protein